MTRPTWRAAVLASILLAALYVVAWFRGMGWTLRR